MLLVAVGVILLGVVAWSAGRSDVDGGARADVGTPLDESTRNDLGLVMIGAAGMVVVLAILPFFFRRRDRLRGERDIDSPVNWRRVVATIVFGLVAVYVMLLVARRDEEDATEAPPAPPPEETEEGAPGDAEGATGWTAVAFLGSGAVVVLVAAAVVHHRLRGRRPQIDAATAMSAPAPLGPLELDGLEPAEAVRAAYAGALRRLGTIGAGRWAAETPREHLARVRTLAPDAIEPLSVLIARYEVVRYSHHSIDEQMKADAIRAYRSLTTLVDDHVREVVAT